MTRALPSVACFLAVVSLPAVASTEATAAAPIERSDLLSAPTLVAVVGALLIALLIVALVRRLDR